MKGIRQSVGNGGANEKSDVLTVQRLINRAIVLLSPLMRLKEDGDCGPITVGVIKEFQRRVCKALRPDGRIDPGKTTWKKLVEVSESGSCSAPKKGSFDWLLLKVQTVQSGGNCNEPPRQPCIRGLSEADYKRAAGVLGVEVAAVKAVASVESSGGGFLSYGKPKILFEGHVFSRRTKGAYDKTHPTISYPTWTTKHYRNGLGGYERYNLALSLSKEAAMQSTSWGKFQIMGFNHAHAGYPTVGEFVKAMCTSEGKQLEAFMQYLKSTKIGEPLKAKDWTEFARLYNGPSHAKNNYSSKMQQAYEAYATEPTP